MRILIAGRMNTLTCVVFIRLKEGTYGLSAVLHAPEADKYVLSAV